MTCSCLIPAKYEFIVVAARPLFSHQPTKTKVWLSAIGRFIITPVSSSHFSRILAAVVYVLQVFFAIAWFAAAARVFFTSSDALSCLNVFAEKFPFGPYFVTPCTAVGLNTNKRVAASTLELRD